MQPKNQDIGILKWPNVHAYHFSLSFTFTELQSADVTVIKNSTLQSKEDKSRPEHETSNSGAYHIIGQCVQ